MRIALYQPDIPQNTGTILRLCACLGIEAHLIGPAGFPASDRAFRRAGMDHLDAVAIVRHRSWGDFDSWRRAGESSRLVLFTTAGPLSYLDYGYQADDILMFGRESAGVPPEVHAAADARLVIPMRPGLRSLNVAAAVAMAGRSAGFRSCRRVHRLPARDVSSMSRSRSATTKQRSRVISARDANRNEKCRRVRKKPRPPTRPIPRFRSEAEEREFWETHDSADYVDWSKAQRARFPNLKLSTTAISLRLPQGLLDRIKIAANKRDVPYQSLIKVWLNSTPSRASAVFS